MLLPEIVRLLPPEKYQRVPCAEDVVPAVFPVNAHSWAYFELFADRSAVVRYAGRFTDTPDVLTVIDPPVIAPFVPAYLLES